MKYIIPMSKNNKLKPGEHKNFSGAFLIYWFPKFTILLIWKSKKQNG